MLGRSTGKWVKITTLLLFFINCFSLHIAFGLCCINIVFLVQVKKKMILLSKLAIQTFWMIYDYCVTNLL